jgi:hypothetical protein
MQEVRRTAFAVCLLASMAAGSAGTMPNRAHRAGKMADGILATILDFFGVTLNDQISIPPG